MTRKYEMTIGGQRVGASAYEEVRNPANGEVVGLCPVGTAEHLEQAVAAAEKAFADWRHSADQRRRDACRAIADVITDNAPELAVLLSKEQGKPLKGLGAEFELGGCAAWAAYPATVGLPVRVIDDSPGRRVEMHREPIGVCGSITPWNWPLMIAVWHLVPAIRTGNTVVIKPSPYTPLGTLRLIELIAAVLPPGVVNVVAGNDQVGAALTQHPRVSKVIFTGSIGTGKKVMAAAAPTLKSLTLELGGNDAGIVLPDVDMTRLVESMFWGAFINSGQTCGALKRLYVHDSVYDEVCGALVAYGSAVRMGDGLDTNNVLGPIQNERQFRKVVDLVEEAKRDGATVLLGGEPSKGRGYFYPVTLLGDCRDGMRIVDEEQFGPVLPIIRYSDIEQAIERANGLEYGLDASVWGSNPEELMRVAARLEAGTVFINKHAEVAPNVPFGGIKCSGLGVEFGEEGLEAYTTIKVINVAR
jgi:acyl-CoA reductase-like NAD-dependent aldehyde dehydrogenase